MSKKKRSLRKTSVVLALGLGGCGLAPVKEQKEAPAVEATAAAPKPTQATGGSTADDQAVDASIQKSLDRLNALQLFSVQGLVLNLPAQAYECYNLPCAGDTASWAAYHAERARQAPRLEQLANEAEQCNSGNCYVFTPTSPDEAVQALNALQIIRTSSLVVAQPANNPSCYNLPCESDKAAADAENQRRATETFTIAQYLKLQGT